MAAVDCVIFGSIGTLAHCCELQWKLFNQALKEKCASGAIPEWSSENKDIFWEKDIYIASLTNTGGKSRLKVFLEAGGVANATEELCAEIHERKTELFIAEINTGALTLRAGIRELLAACKAAGIKTAFCTTTDKRVVDAFVANLGLQDSFDFCLSASDMPEFGDKGKPEPDCYWHVLKSLFGEEGFANKKAVCFEDTQISMTSALKAGVPCIATPNEWSKTHDFSAAKMCAAEVGALAEDGTKVLSVISELGAPVQAR